MTKYENLKLMDVLDKDDKLVLTFVDIDQNEAHDIIWRKQKYDESSATWVDSEEKIDQVNQWCIEYLGVDLEHVEDAIGIERDVYSYDSYESLWETLSRFDSSMKNKTITGVIDSVTLGDLRAEVRFRYNGDLYACKKNYRKDVGEHAFVDKQKKQRALASLENLLEAPIQDLVDGKRNGEEIKVQVKTFGKAVYCDLIGLK